MRKKRNNILKNLKICFIIQLKVVKEENEMLLRFKVKNYRSLRDEVVLDMEAAGLGDHKECLMKYKGNEYLPVVSINGKNGGGKSNVIRAMWLAAQFIKNAQRTQHESAEVPVRPFELNDYSRNEPTSFEFEYEYEGIEYCYGFSATRKCICEEHLYWAPKGQRAVVFNRKYQDFSFPINTEKKIKELISRAVAPNQLFFSMSCTMNYEPCIRAMKWFRTKLFFSRAYSDLGKNLLDYSDDSEMLKSIVSIAKVADLGISDMKFEINNKIFTSLEELPEDIPFESKQQIEKALAQFKESLSGDADNVDGAIQYNELKATSFHVGVDSEQNKREYPLSLSDESDGTIRLMARVTAMESAIKNGGVLIIDEIEDRLHPMLVEYIIKRFQYKNTTNAQLIFTTHSIDIMNREMLRRDQYYLVDKNGETGVSELYSVSDFSVRNDEKVGKAYLLGKYGAVPYIREE